MVSAYQEIINFDGVNFHDHLERIGLYDTFEPIITEFTDNVIQIKVCQYVVYTHSAESSKIHVGSDRRKTISSVFRELELPDALYESVVCLESSAVVNAAKNWMKKQDEKQCEYLFTLQNAYVQQQTASLKMLRKANGEVDYDQKMRCIEHMESLKKKIKDAESELLQNTPKLSSAYEEVKQAMKKKNTFGIEKFANE